MKKVCASVVLHGKRYAESGKFNYFGHSFAGFGAVEWNIFRNPDEDRYILGTKITDHMVFIELMRSGSSLVLTREWRRRPRSDRSYALPGAPMRYHGMRQPTSLEGQITSSIKPHEYEK